MSQAAFWSSAFGKKLSAQQILEMHPLRSREATAEAGPSAETLASESALGWAVLRAGFGGK